MFYKTLLLLSESGTGPQSWLLDVNPGVLLWTIIIFTFLLLILKKVAWKPILSALDEREKFIRESIQKAEDAQKQAEDMLKANQERLAQAEEEAQKIIEQGREYAEKVKEQILSESKDEARKMISEAQIIIERKNQESFAKLKTEIADIAVGAAEKIIRAELSAEKQKALVDSYIKELNQN